MKSPKKKIEKLIAKHHRIMRMKHLDHGTASMHYGIYKGLIMALKILEESKTEQNESK